MFLVGFSGFRRYNEISNLKVKNIKFHDLPMSMFIEKCETYVYRRGNKVIISNNEQCIG